ncbi:PAS domain-containing protein, partial [Acinetobacter baumannii]
MPPEAFEDLWLTIKAGQPWRGLVKNRSKNGDHYWVEAFVTPITVDGRTVGYQSVRNAPKREEVAAAETLYRAVRDKTA